MPEEGMPEEHGGAQQPVADPLLRGEGVCARNIAAATAAAPGHGSATKGHAQEQASPGATAASEAPDERTRQQAYWLGHAVEPSLEVGHAAK